MEYACVVLIVLNTYLLSRQPAFATCSRVSKGTVILRLSFCFFCLFFAICLIVLSRAWEETGFRLSPSLMENLEARWRLSPGKLVLLFYSYLTTWKLTSCFVQSVRGYHTTIDECPTGDCPSTPPRLSIARPTLRRG